LPKTQDLLILRRVTKAAISGADALTSNSPKSPSVRIASIDALRGFVMFMMIFVNDLAGGGKIVPDWMVHYYTRHGNASGMTFVDLVFPAFLFIVGMSIPFALGSRLNAGEPLWKIALHIVTRTGALLAIGILMVNCPSAASKLWEPEMFFSAILAFCTISPRAGATPSQVKFWRILSLCLRGIGYAGLIYCVVTWEGPKGEHIITLSPFDIRTSWYGILGKIGWSYFIAAVVFLVFRAHRTALLGCLALMFCFFAGDRNGSVGSWWIARHVVSLSDTVGSHAALTVAGVLLASILVAPDKRAHRSRMGFALLFVAGCAIAAMLLTGLYGISKEEATPAWCLWSCAITTAIWMGFYYLCDMAQIGAKPLVVAGQNVLLAYLLSEMLHNPLHLLSIGSEPVLAWVICRSLLWAFILLWLTVALNRVGFRLKL
jgi:predicted acyltransferase